MNSKRGRAAVAAGVALATAGIVGGITLASAGPERPASPQGEVRATIALGVAQSAHANQDGNTEAVTSSEVVLTTQQAALDLFAPGDTVPDGSAPSYLVQVQGSFVGYTVKHSSTEPLMTGRVMWFVARADTGLITDWGMGQQPVALGTLGEVSTLPLEPAA